ncbi:MAG: hypothetical protein WCQ67_03450 [Treponema sp.]
MKKIFSILCLTVVILFCSCSNLFIRTVTITNSSDYNVSFTLENYQDKTVYSLNSKTSIDLELYSNPTINLINNPRVSYASGANNVLISNLKSYTYKITNKSFKEITLSEANKMLGTTYGDTVVMPASIINDDKTVQYSSKQVIVYTDKPEWKAIYTSDNTSDAISDLEFSKL